MNSSHQALEALAVAIDSPFFVHPSIGSPETPFLLGQTLSAAIAPHQKRSLVIAGGFLEGAVTLGAISTLLDGYNVHVVVDFVETIEPDVAHICYDRIRDCGGVLTTHTQLVLELLAQQPDPKKRTRLQKLLNQKTG